MYLVTGGSGLVGGHLLIKLVEAGYTVRALYRTKNSIEKAKKIFSFYGNTVVDSFSKIEWVQGDVEDVISLDDAMENISFVYHCAAVVSFKKSDLNWIRKINVEGTANVVNCCLKHNVKKLCHVSSTAAIGSGKNGELIHEELKWTKEKNISNYSVSKYQAEMEVWRGMEEGLDAVIVNPSVILGPGDWTASSSELFNTVWKGLKFYTTGKNAFVDVRDVVNCMILLMDGDYRNNRFLVVSENWTFQQLFNSIAAGLNKPHPNIKVKKWFLGLAWRIEKVRSTILNSNPVVTKETAHSSMEVKEYSNDKITTTLQYNFIPIEQSIQDTCELFFREKS